MRVPLDELRRGLGAPAFELWVRLRAAADRRGLVKLSRSEMMNGTGVSEASVKRSLERLRKAGLVSAAASRKDPTRQVLGRKVSTDRADVPAEAWRFVRSSPGRGGRRRGAGRPSRNGEKSNRAESRNQTGPRMEPTLRDDAENGSSRAEVSRPALKNGEKSNRAEKRNQTGPSQYNRGIYPDPTLSPSLRSVDSVPARGCAGARSYSTDDAGEVAPELLPELADADVLSLEAAVRALGLEDVPPRTLPELLRLEGVPKLLLRDGRRAELGVRSPAAPEAVASRPPAEVLAHLARLWRETTAFVFGEGDLRMNGVAASKGGSKLAKGVLAWWRACDEKDVRPAEWLLWELEGWRKRHPTKKVQIPGVMSEKRVRDGKIRRIFRISSRRFGGRVAFDDVGRAYLRKTQVLERRLDRLVAERLCRVTDDEVLEAVREIFPKGAENAATILEDIHSRTTAETTRLADLAALGSFVWADEQ